MHASEAVFDAEQLSLMASLGAEEAQKLSSQMMHVTSEKFIKRLQQQYGNRNGRRLIDEDEDSDETDSRDDVDSSVRKRVHIDWNSLGKHESLNNIFEVPVVAFL